MFAGVCHFFRQCLPEYVACPFSVCLNVSFMPSVSTVSIVCVLCLVVLSVLSESTTSSIVCQDVLSVPSEEADAPVAAGPAPISPMDGPDGGFLARPHRSDRGRGR